MKTATITKLSEKTFAVLTDLFMSNCMNWAGEMLLKGDTLVSIPGVIYSYCPKISLPNHTAKLREMAVGESIKIG